MSTAQLANSYPRMCMRVPGCAPALMGPGVSNLILFSLVWLPSSSFALALCQGEGDRHPVPTVTSEVARNRRGWIPFPVRRHLVKAHCTSRKNICELCCDRCLPGGGC